MYAFVPLFIYRINAFSCLQTKYGYAIIITEYFKFGVTYMNTVKFDKRSTKMVAHRGLSGIERENTYPAFIAAANRSYYGIETDVHVTADGKFVVIHDSTTERVSGGAINVNVEEACFDELTELTFPDLDGKLERRDIKIPSLADYVNICKKYGKICVLELKNRFEKANTVKMVEEIKALDYLENMIFISFSFDNCMDLRSILPNAKIQFLFSDAVTDELFTRLKENKFDLDIYYKSITKEWIDKLHAHGIEVNVWTCNGKDEAEALAEMGVDYITTNILE